MLHFLWIRNIHALHAKHPVADKSVAVGDIKARRHFGSVEVRKYFGIGRVRYVNRPKPALARGEKSYIAHYFKLSHIAHSFNKPYFFRLFWGRNIVHRKPVIFEGIKFATRYFKRHCSLCSLHFRKLDRSPVSRVRMGIFNFRSFCKCAGGKKHRKKSR